MADIQNHTIAGQLNRCAASIIAGTDEGGLFGAVTPEGEYLYEPTVGSVVMALNLAGRRAHSAAADPEPHLRRLVILSYLAAACESEMQRVASELRAGGHASWSQIAEATGMKSKQAAAYRFGGAS